MAKHCAEVRWRGDGKIGGSLILWDPEAVHIVLRRVEEDYGDEPWTFQ